jgi:hypothetical protein
MAKSEKRGLGWKRAPLDAELAWLGGDTAESLDLSQALNDLAEFDPTRRAWWSCTTFWLHHG